MVSVQFTEEDRQALNFERFHYPDPRVQQKMEVVWLVSQGLSRTEVARLLAFRCEQCDGMSNGINREASRHSNVASTRSLKVNWTSTPKP